MQFWWYTSFSETWGWHHGCISGNVSWFEQTTQTIHFYTFFAPGRTDKVSLELRSRLGKESLVSDCQWVIGYHLVIQHSHGKSPFFIGKPSINGPFSMAMLKNQRVFSKMCWIFLLHSWGRSTLPSRHLTTRSRKSFCWPVRRFLTEEQMNLMQGRTTSPVPWSWQPWHNERYSTAWFKS